MFKRFADRLEYLGYEVKWGTNPLFDGSIIEAEVETKAGKLHIVCGANGTARIDKPNGTHKWVYQKTFPQIEAVLKQTRQYYR